MSKEAMRVLMDSDWHENVRQLENTIQIAILKATGAAITPDDLPPDINHQIVDDGDLSLANIEKRHILKILNQVDGKVHKAAEILDINPSTLYRKLKKMQESAS